jgi:hypothetical protein
MDLAQTFFLYRSFSNEYKAFTFLSSALASVSEMEWDFATREERSLWKVFSGLRGSFGQRERRRV